MHMLKLTVIVLVAVLGTTMNAAALPIDLTNSSFEATVLGENGYTSSIDGWIITGSAGTYNPSASQFTQAVPDGNNTAWVNTGSVQQTTGAILQAGVVYTLSASVGDRTFVAFPGWSISIIADGNVVATLDHEDVNGPPNGQFMDVMLNYSTDASDILVGTYLGVRLNSNGTQTNFDDVQFVDNAVASEVPEPAALSLLAFAGFVMLRRRSA